MGGRKFRATTTGSVGLVWKQAQEGDENLHLHGGDAPFILRKTGDRSGMYQTL